MADTLSFKLKELGLENHLLLFILFSFEIWSYGYFLFKNQQHSLLPTRSKHKREIERKWSKSTCLLYVTYLLWNRQCKTREITVIFFFGEVSLDSSKFFSHSKCTKRSAVVSKWETLTHFILYFFKKNYLHKSIAGNLSIDICI